MNDASAPKEEGFLRRWARLKATPEPVPADTPRPVAASAPPAVPSAVPPAAPPAISRDGPARPLPTLDDVARLTPQSDYSVFVSGGVDPAVRRLALKKLFADPNFAVMDGLDIYIDDYTRPSPLAGAMLASLRHAPNVLARLLGDSGETAQAAGQETHCAAAPDDAPAPDPAAPDPSPQGTP